MLGSKAAPSNEVRTKSDQIRRENLNRKVLVIQLTRT